jgi:hypothetical protein
LRDTAPGGSQTVRVERVHVNEGGQALIGNVNSIPGQPDVGSQGGRLSHSAETIPARPFTFRPASGGASLWLALFSEGSAIAYVGQTPWHGLGEKLAQNQSIEAWIKAARLDWELKMLPVHYLIDGTLSLRTSEVI